MGAQYAYIVLQLFIMAVKGYSAKNETSAFHIRMFGGTEALLGDFPFMVAIVSPRSGQDCGGVIIDAKHILTAAHCSPISQRRPHLTVVAGITDVCTNFLVPIQRSQQIRTIRRWYIHDQYQFKRLQDGGVSPQENDIAIAVVDQPFKFNLFVSPVPLPVRPLNSNTNIMCQVIGWGKTWNNGKIRTREHNGQTCTQPGNVHPCNLRGGWLSTHTSQQCLNTYAFFKPRSQICACNHPMGGDATACMGDSGGPLVCNGKLHGIVSSGPNQCDPSNPLPTIYTRVFDFTPWIKGILNAD